jgi:hypothetical protein
MVGATARADARAGMDAGQRSHVKVPAGDRNRNGAAGRKAVTVMTAGLDLWTNDLVRRGYRLSKSVREAVEMG